MNNKQSEAVLDIATRRAGSGNASDAPIASTHQGADTTIPNVHQCEQHNTPNHQEAEETISNAHQFAITTRRDSGQAQEIDAQNLHQPEKSNTPNIFKGLEASTPSVQQSGNTVINCQPPKETDTPDTHKSDEVADGVVHGTAAHIEDEELEKQKHGEKNSKKRKPVRESSASTLQTSKRARSASSEVIHRRQFESPFQIPLLATERMQNIETHEIKRNLNYLPNRTSAVLKPDGTQNNISVEAHLVQERGEVFTSRCNSCGNKGRPAGPWEECVALDGFLQGSCANCHVNNLGKRCSLRRKFFPDGTRTQALNFLFSTERSLFSCSV
ncbi:hypothetical protein OCU04_012763 [Sclerotinia nivalis]|uniref:Uncharacterized protein n=1 Tax=Sclerotinia nivalis TaxID=352851 RepID=A0A9X0A9E1_9HELO|nr:hypothetical protein OCU04_012763 [Sclerotinia nivalis]